MISNVLTICEGNLCRSPMAAGFLEEGMAGVRVKSAGLNAVVGHPPPREATQCMAEAGVDIASHRAVQVSGRLCMGADLILVMSADQLQQMTQLYPVVRGKVFLLRGSDGTDVADPFGRSIESFRACRETIRSGVAFWLRRISVANAASTQGIAGIARRGQHPVVAESMRPASNGVRR